MAETYTTSMKLRVRIVNENEEERKAQYRLLRNFMEAQSHCMNFYTNKIISECVLSFHNYNGFIYYTNRAEKLTKDIEVNKEKISEKIIELEVLNGKEQTDITTEKINEVNKVIKSLTEKSEKLKAQLDHATRNIELTKNFSQKDLELATQLSFSNPGVLRQCINERYKDHFNAFPDSVSFIIKNIFKGIGINVTTLNRDQKFIDIVTAKGKTPVFKNDYPITMLKRYFEFYEENGKFYILYKLANKQTILFEVILTEKQTKNYIKFVHDLNLILSGEHKLGDSELFFKDDKLYIALATSKPTRKRTFKKGRVMGIDIGVNTPAVASFNDIDTYKFFGSKEGFHDVILNYKERRKAIARNVKYTKGGKGRKKKLQALNKISEKQKNYRDTYNHQLSRDIISFAIENECGVINLEDLSKLTKKIQQKENKTEKEKELLDWSYYDLQQKIKYKAAAENIKVFCISPAYTSQKCCECGEIGRRDFDTKEIFMCTNEKCSKYNKKVNADLNASKNIANHKKE